MADYKCPCCSAVFSTQHDLDLHLTSLGTDKEKHLEKLKRLHEETEHLHGRYMKV